MIRNAVRDDFEAIWCLLMMMHKEQALFSLDRSKTAAAIAKAIDTSQAWVALNNAIVIGTCAATSCEVWYSSEPFMGDMWIYVHPDHRHSRHAIGLRNAMVKAASNQGLVLMCGAVGKSLEGKRLYGRGFEEVGSLFMLRN